MKKILLIASLLFLSACGGGSSSSGGAAEPTAAGSMIPANFVGTYTGSVTLVLSALGFQERDTFPITFTVSADGMLTVASSEIDETVTVGVTDAGVFVATISRQEDPCGVATINVSGNVNGTTATGTVEGSATCEVNGLSVDVELSGDFSASK